jgi:hypothetical protein
MLIGGCAVRERGDSAAAGNGGSFGADGSGRSASVAVGIEGAVGSSIDSASLASGSGGAVAMTDSGHVRTAPLSASGSTWTASGIKPAFKEGVTVDRSRPTGSSSAVGAIAAARANLKVPVLPGGAERASRSTGAVLGGKFLDINAVQKAAKLAKRAALSEVATSLSSTAPPSAVACAAGASLSAAPAVEERGSEARGQKRPRSVTEAPVFAPGLAAAAVPPSDLQPAGVGVSVKPAALAPSGSSRKIKIFRCERFGVASDIVVCSYAETTIRAASAAEVKGSQGRGQKRPRSVTDASVPAPGFAASVVQPTDLRPALRAGSLKPAASLPHRAAAAGSKAAAAGAAAAGGGASMKPAASLPHRAAAAASKAAAAAASAVAAGSLGRLRAHHRDPVQPGSLALPMLAGAELSAAHDPLVYNQAVVGPLQEEVLARRSAAWSTAKLRDALDPYHFDANSKRVDSMATDALNPADIQASQAAAFLNAPPHRLRAPPRPHLMAVTPGLRVHGVRR